MKLVGKFFFRMGKEYSQSGEVVSEASPGNVFVRLDHHDSGWHPSLVMLAIEEMRTKRDKDGEFEIEWEFFDSRAELDGFKRFIDDLDKQADDVASKPATAQLN